MNAPINGRRLTLTNDRAYDLIMAIAIGKLNGVTVIVERIRGATGDRR